jgi:hypothetical protein
MVINRVNKCRSLYALKRTLLPRNETTVDTDILVDIGFLGFDALWTCRWVPKLQRGEKCVFLSPILTYSPP